MFKNFKSKAGTLESLETKLLNAKIAKMVVFTTDQWRQKKIKILDDIQSHFGNVPLIVRSSCSQEDTLANSNAGRFDSIQNVTKAQIEFSIDQVISSYGVYNALDEVLVQPMLKNVVMSGVAFSHDPSTCSPYRMINWCDGSDTTLVTGGKAGNLFQIAAHASVPNSSKFSKILKLLNELLEFFGGVPLDCEFAITKINNKSTLWLLQVRPLVLASNPETDEKQWKRLSDIKARIKEDLNPKPFLLGKTTIFGMMPDWNPAEIIGTRPKPLALSLYRELFTDAVWAYQRDNYGYRDLRSHCIMRSFVGMPYIDVRVSFNSFIPKDLDVRIGNILVNYYLSELAENPNLHDKVEFEIVWSCFTFDLSKQLKKLTQVGLSSGDQSSISRSLCKLTNEILDPVYGLWIKDSQKLEKLKLRREQIINSKLSKVDRVYWLLEDAKRYGTLPFAGLARAAFIAVQMLKSLVRVGILSENDYERFMESVSTVSSKMENDFFNLNKNDFLSNYGHLRPGTYDINSPRYDEDPNQYFDWVDTKVKPPTTESFKLTDNQSKKINRLLIADSINIDATQLIDFFRNAIEFRELAKFEFTRNLSDALSLITEIGLDYGLSREDLSYCDIKSLKEMHVSFSDDIAFLKQNSDYGRQNYSETCKIALPPLIVKSEDVLAFEWPESEPNFITQKQITAPIVDFRDRRSLRNAIVCIPNADPGFDWLFNCSIAGLVTAWGGSNSHMAIRANEKGLPAVIGAGRLLFDRCSAAQRINLDCRSRKVEIL